MTHRLKIIEDVAFVMRNGFINALVDVATPGVLLCVRQALMSATNVHELRMSVQQLPSCLPALELEIAKDGDVISRGGQFRFPLAKLKPSSPL
jgi:hypothetical protein